MKRKLVRSIFLTLFLLATSFLSLSQDPNKSRIKMRVSSGTPVPVPGKAPFLYTEKIVPFIQRSADRTALYSSMPILVDPYPGYTARTIVPPNSKDYTMRIVPSGMGSTNIIIRRKR